MVVKNVRSRIDKFSNRETWDKMAIWQWTTQPTEYLLITTFIFIRSNSQLLNLQSSFGNAFKKYLSAKNIWNFPYARCWWNDPARKLPLHIFIKLKFEEIKNWKQSCNEALRIFVLQRFLAKDPSLSSSSVHFKLLKNLRSFEDFRPKIPKIFGIKSLFVEEILKEN